MVEVQKVLVVDWLREGWILFMSMMGKQRSGCLLCGQVHILGNLIWWGTWDWEGATWRHLGHFFLHWIVH